MQITLPAGSPTIDATTDLRIGFMLTANISLDALTRGVVNTGTYPFKTIQTAEIPAVSAGLARWQVAQNLQYVAAGIIEPLITHYPGDVTILSSYVNPQDDAATSETSKHFSGEAVDIILDTKEGNMFAVAGDIYRLVGGVCVEFGLIFSSRSWIHLSINGPQQRTGVVPSSTQSVYTRDMTTSQNYSGLFPARGTVVPETIAMNGILDSYPWGSFGNPPFALL